MEKINEKYYLGSNKNNFVLYEKKVSSTTGKESFKAIGYMMTLDKVYTTLLDKEIKEDLTLLNNIPKIASMINELKQFTVKYVDEHK